MNLPALTVTTGDTIVVTLIGANAFDFGCSVASTISITDTQSNSYTLRVQSPDVVGSGANTCIYTAPVASTGTDTITVATTPHNEVWNIAALDYSGAIGFGATGTDEKTVNPTDSSTVTMTVSSTSVIVEAQELTYNGNSAVITETSGQIIRNPFTGTIFESTTDVTGKSGSTGFTFSWVISGTPCTTPNFCRLSHSALELTFSPPVFSQVRWNFNSTCVTMHSMNQARVDFDWSRGTSGLGGANCNSANIMISKSQVNFQTASGRDLEIIWMAASLNTTNTQSVDLVFRTNSTLPSFSENYNPFNDTNARLIYEACTRFSTACQGSGQTVYIQHDPNKNINNETRANDFVVSGAVPDFRNNAPVWFQAVLNFTGPNNFINEQTSISTTANSNNTASAFQMGQSYNILFKVNSIGAPSGSPAAEITNSFGPGPNGIPAPFSIWSVPPSCADPLNKVACGFGTPTPIFQFNPLDPSSWGNAIIQGLLWVFTVALPTGLLVIAKVLLQVIQVTFNAVGQQFGWGNIGDNIVKFFNSLPSLFGQIGAVLGNLANIVSSVINTIIIANLLANPYFAGLVNVLNDFKVAIGSGIIVSLLNQIAFWFPTSYMIILISTYFLFVFMKGLHGFFDWLHIVKWTSFQLVGLFSLFIDVFISLITAILGRLSIISPGHKFPRIPHPNPGSLPKIQLGGEIAFFDDPTAWFLAFTGFIFTMMWAGTSSAGLPANTQSIIQSFSTLFLTLFGVGFMILLLYIPGFVLAKLHDKGMIS